MSKLTPKHKAALNRAKREKYLITSSRQNDALKNAYRHWCEVEEIPCIILSDGLKFADITIDVDTLRLCLDDHTKSQLTALHREYSHSASLEVSDKFCFFQKVPLADSRDLVKEILLLFPMP